MPTIISSLQSGFVHGRQILDGVVIANECIHSSDIHSSDKDEVPGLICKFDLENAFDRVDWRFLLYIKRRMGFGVKRRKWIHECISSATFYILINGSPIGFFQAQRGLRQGDPLSPFLFTIVGEALSCMITIVGEANLINGFKSAASAPTITRLQFAVETLLFCKA